MKSYRYDGLYRVTGMRSSSGVQLSNRSPMDIDTEMPQNDESYLASLERWEDECCMNNKDFMEGLNISTRATGQDSTHIKKTHIHELTEAQEKRAICASWSINWDIQNA